MSRASSTEEDETKVTVNARLRHPSDDLKRNRELPSQGDTRFIDN
jgi:hypothetical protein